MNRHPDSDAYIAAARAREAAATATVAHEIDMDPEELQAFLSNSYSNKGKVHDLQEKIHKRATYIRDAE